MGGKISVADIQRWNPDDIGRVFDLAKGTSEHATNTALQVRNLPAFGTWQGKAADQAKDSTEKTKKDLELHGEMANGVAEAAKAAEMEVTQVKANLKKLVAACEQDGFILDPASDTIKPAHPIQGGDSEEDVTAAKKQAQDQELLVKWLATILTEADAADQELAKAIGAATGKHVSFAPTKSDIVLGSAGALVGAKTDIIADIWRASLGKAPTGVEAKVLPWVTDISKLGTTRIGAGMGALMAVPSVFADVHEGDGWGKAVAREAAGFRAGTSVSSAVSKGVKEATEKASQAFSKRGLGTMESTAGEAADGGATAAEGTEAGATAAEAGADVAATTAETGTAVAAAAEAGETAAEGAAVGTAVCPGVGTVLGAVGGAVAGGVAAYGVSKAVKWLL